MAPCAGLKPDRWGDLYLSLIRLEDLIVKKVFVFTLIKKKLRSIEHQHIWPTIISSVQRAYQWLLENNYKKKGH